MTDPVVALPSTSIIVQNHRLIHLDLKGAPPKVSYLKELFPLISKHGATGLLIEYEDTFPYAGSLRHLRKLPDRVLQTAYVGKISTAVTSPLQGLVTSQAPVTSLSEVAASPCDASVTQHATESCGATVTTTTQQTPDSNDAMDVVSTPTLPVAAPADTADPPYYTEEDITQILACAADNGLMVIPLLQTFGHVEFLLKHRRHRHLRESPCHPNALCPRHPGALPLVQECVQQLLQAHPSARYLHIGCDEVLLGACERCSGTTREAIYLQWVVGVCGWVRERYPHITPIIWDDMIRNMSLEQLQESGIGTAAELMIWKYEAGELQFPDGYLSRVSKVFGSSGGVWAASAYKGATGASQCLVNVQYHVDNHVAWLHVLREHVELAACFRGIALTGWQRYDHMSVLCELLPASTPCMLLCLAVLGAGSCTPAVHSAVAQSLGLHSLVGPTTAPRFEEDNLQFPGHGLYSALHRWVNFCATYSMEKNSEINRGWYNHYRRRQGFLSPGILEMVRQQCQRMQFDIAALHRLLQQELLRVYDRHTTQEWLACFVQPLQEKIGRSVLECAVLRGRDTSCCDADTCSCHR